jgi:hypothetical protein
MYENPKLGFSKFRLGLTIGCFEIKFRNLALVSYFTSGVASGRKNQSEYK